MTAPKLPKTARAPHKRRARGFTLVEILVVIGIIAITAAVSLPNIAGYMRASKIRSAQDALSGALNKGRNMAIMRNTQLGIVFAVQSNTVFWVHIEDTIPGVSPAGDVGYTRQGVDFANANPLVSTRYVLPSGVEFAATTGDCPAIPTFAPSQSVLRFDRFGLSSIPTAANLMVLNGGSTTTNRIFAPVSGDRAVCLIDRTTNLRRWVKIAPGGGITRG